MMRSLFSGVSGLKNHQTRMDVVGNNISNVNTTGFKSSRATFSDMLSQTLTGAAAPTDNLGGTNPKQIGLGSSVSSIDLLFTNGSVQSTGKNTDLALSGNGLFVVSDGNQRYYTRNGAFEFDADGNYVQPGNGLHVMGWMAKDGNLTTNGEVVPIKIPAGKPMAAKASMRATYTNNLNSEVPTIASLTPSSGTPPTATATTANPVTVKMSDGTTYTMTNGKYTVGHSLPLTTTLTVYDALGGKHDITLYFTKTKTDSTNGNEWTVSVNTNGTGTATIKEKDGSTTTVAMANQTLKFTTDGKFNSGAGTINLTLTNGATGSQTVAVGLSSLTQYAGSNTISGKADGYAAGTLESVSIDKSGILTGTYTNGVKQIEGQVAVAQFNNASGLTKNGDSLYQESNNSGVANIKTAADLGCKITPSALEMSNVDIANEFTDMIVTQRGFQSNSKTITVSDEMLETLINMKR